MKYIAKTDKGQIVYGELMGFSEGGPVRMINGAYLSWDPLTTEKGWAPDVLMLAVMGLGTDAKWVFAPFKEAMIFAQLVALTYCTPAAEEDIDPRIEHEIKTLYISRNKRTKSKENDQRDTD